MREVLVQRADAQARNFGYPRSGGCMRTLEIQNASHGVENGRDGSLRPQLLWLFSCLFVTRTLGHLKPETYASGPKAPPMPMLATRKNIRTVTGTLCTS